MLTQIFPSKDSNFNSDIQKIEESLRAEIGCKKDGYCPELVPALKKYFRRSDLIVNFDENGHIDHIYADEVITIPLKQYEVTGMQFLEDPEDCEDDSIMDVAISVREVMLCEIASLLTRTLEITASIRAADAKKMYNRIETATDPILIFATVENGQLVIRDDRHALNNYTKSDIDARYPIAGRFNFRKQNVQG